MSDNFVAETAARIFADLADPQTINKARDGAWKEALWQALAENGLTLGAPGIYSVTDEPLRALTGVRMDDCAIVGVAPRGPAPEPVVPHAGATANHTMAIGIHDRRIIISVPRRSREALANRCASSRDHPGDP